MMMAAAGGAAAAAVPPDVVAATMLVWRRSGGDHRVILVLREMMRRVRMAIMGMVGSELMGVTMVRRTRLGRGAGGAMGGAMMEVGMVVGCGREETSDGEAER